MTIGLGTASVCISMVHKYSVFLPMVVAIRRRTRPEESKHLIWNTNENGPTWLLDGNKINKAAATSGIR